VRKPVFCIVTAIVAVLCFAGAPGAAAPAPQNPAAADTLSPALITNSISLDKDKGPFVADECRNYALEGDAQTQV
jgi:hypothetical protein